MTRLARRASLLVAFYLLTSAATASAECAWVLWRQRVATDQYSVLRAYPDQAACERGAAVVAAATPSR
jgi:hypothetical protein